MNGTYLDRLRAASDAAETIRQREAAAAKRLGIDSRVVCDTPLTDQIEALMHSLPPVQANRPWTMEELLLRLQGRYHARPHAMNVGTALRRLGWAQRRDWTREGGGRRYWLPPQ
jgi:hypothetical protein